MRPPNLLFICADEHTRSALKCYGSSFIHSPHLDALAANGLRFANAYTNSPLCVPARAALMTGEYVHTTRCWDNGHPYHGTPDGWSHRLRQRGYHTVAIGKNHFRSVADDNGFERELLPMHVRNGVGDLFGLLRKEAARYPGRGDAEAGATLVRGPAIMADAAGPGETNHTMYDRSITAAACEWLERDAPARRPWALYVSFVAPHFPLMAPEDFFSLYPENVIPQPLQYERAERPTHPVVQALCRTWNFDDYFDPAKILRARAGYYGLVSFLDANIGKVVGALDKSGMRSETCIVYTSDHGEMLGNKGIWSTSALYEDSVAVPLIISGPGVQRGSVESPVSHVDILPTLLEISGDLSGHGGPGTSLFGLRDDAANRPVLSEYHAGGSITGCYMLRLGRFKYHHYVGERCELFDITKDPTEANDLGEDPGHSDARAHCEAALRGILDPERVSEQAFADQAATIARHGGADAVRLRGHPGEHALDRPLGIE